MATTHTLVKLLPVLTEAAQPRATRQDDGADICLLTPVARPVTPAVGDML